MRQFYAVSKNTFLQTVRQPLYGIVVLVVMGGMALSPSLTGWTLDDDDKMLRDVGLSTLLVQGLFLACFAASAVLNTEIEDKTVLTSVAKPVQRLTILTGKFAGVMLALLTAHYIAGIAFFMAMRHGVLQSSSQSSDMTVLIFGPFMLLLIVIISAVGNYVRGWRFLPTMVLLCLPDGTFSTLVLLTIDRDWHVQNYEVTQTMDDLPEEVAGEVDFAGIIEFRPLEGYLRVEGHRGHLVRKTWQGPINDDDRQYLLDLSSSERWKKDVDFLAKSCRTELAGIEIFKAGILILGALAILSSLAVAVSTRFGMIVTFLACLFAMGAGLTADFYFLPYTEAGREIAGKTWADIVYPLVPNFQMFWLVDALSEDRLIPVSYIASAFGYAGLWVLGFLALGAAMFETREVG